ncbi:Pvc16 family protein [Serratia marcescens]|uniref:Pvc16 family protein n=1 Tax=Serratia marcescens TaxID=615 RepID=UPI003FA6AEA1
MKNSDMTLIELNTHIRTALEAYLPAEFKTANRIRFDMFDKENLPDSPTVYVFLYDIQEDLELRHGQSRHYQHQTETFSPRYVLVRCCYLLTYWWSGEDKVTEALQVNNMALNALLNLKLGMPEAFVRVIAPSEHLSSLGNFWQSLDKPRLGLSFTVTVPIGLDLEEVVSTPRVMNSSLADMAAKWEHEDVALQFKRALIEAALAAYAQQSEAASASDWLAVRTKLAHLQVTCDYGASQSPDGLPVIRVEGLLDSPLYEIVVSEGEILTGVWKEQGSVDMSALQLMSTKT